MHHATKAPKIPNDVALRVIVLDFISCFSTIS